MNFLNKFAPRIRYMFALLSVGHFLFFFMKPKEKLDTREWERQTCLLADSRDIVDLDCRYYHAKKWILAQPVLAYGEALNCHQLKTARGAELHQVLQSTKCGAPQYWGQPQVMNDIGWDAYSIWWGRAALLFHRSNAKDWPGLKVALLDPTFVKGFPNKEHHHYPWLVSVIYFGVMKLMNSPNPFVLQGIHFFLWVATAFLFWVTWPKAPRYLFLMFAFVPTASIFMTRLYADVWMVFFALLMVWSFQNSWRFLMVTAAACMAFTKQEALVQGLALLLALYSFLPRAKVRRGDMTSFVMSVFLFIFGFLFCSIFKSDFYVSFGARLENFGASSLLLMRNIVPYYLDVLFRPSLWGVLWPLVFFLVWRERKTLGHTVWLLCLVLLAIPFAYLSFPFGHKEVVLTGSGRALWQMLPLVWFMLSEASKSSKDPLFER